MPFPRTAGLTNCLTSKKTLLTDFRSIIAALGRVEEIRYPMRKKRPFVGFELIGMVGFYRERPLKCQHKGWISGMFVTQSPGAGLPRHLFKVL